MKQRQGSVGCAKNSSRRLILLKSEDMKKEEVIKNAEKKETDRERKMNRAKERKK